MVHKEQTDQLGTKLNVKKDLIARKRKYFESSDSEIELSD